MKFYTIPVQHVDTLFRILAQQEEYVPIPGFDPDTSWRFVMWIVGWLNGWVQMFFVAGFGLMILGWLLNTRR